MESFGCNFDDFCYLEPQEDDEMPVTSDDASDEFLNAFDDQVHSIWSSSNSPSRTPNVNINEMNPMSPPQVCNTEEPVNSTIQSFPINVVLQTNIQSAPNIGTLCNSNHPTPPIRVCNAHLGKKKNVYGHGPEVEKLKRRNKDYSSNEDFHELEVYKRFGSPPKTFFIKLGEDYNQFFKEKINKKEMMKFGRDQKRNMKCAVMFFQNQMPQIISFLIAQGFKC